MTLFWLLLENLGHRLAEYAGRQTADPFQFVATLRVWNPKVPS